MAKGTNRVVWGLAVALVVGVVALGVRFRPYWVARYRGEGADLHGTNLQGANLHGVNLRRAWLSDADLQGADLTSADVRGAALYDADLRNADLRGAILRGGGAGITGRLGAWHPDPPAGLQRQRDRRENRLPDAR